MCRSLVLFTFLAVALGPVYAQLGWPTPQLPTSYQFQGFLQEVLDRLAVGGGPARPPACVPFRPEAGYQSLQDYCKALSLADDAFWDDRYRVAAGPTKAGTPFPLKGCVLGCIVGRDSFRLAGAFGAGAWSGKCMRDGGASVVNLLTPLPSIGGAFNVLDTFNWSSFLPVIEQYPGKIGVGTSWWDAFFSLPRGGPIRDTWTITYDDVQPSTTGGQNASVLERTINMYAQLVQGSRDELRLLAPGFMLGQVFRRPNSFLNPTPFPINSNVRFALFQVCDRRGSYANAGNQRNLKPPV